MIKLSHENQEEFERQLELAGFIVKWGQFHLKCNNRTFNPNSKTNVASYSKNSGSNLETVDDIITKINMNHRENQNQKVVVDSVQSQGISFNPKDAIDDSDLEIEDIDQVKEEPFDVKDIKEEDIGDIGDNLKRKRNELDMSIGYDSNDLENDMVYNSIGGKESQDVNQKN